MQKNASQSGSVGFVLFAAFAFLVAGATFLVVFITTQKAAVSHPRSNLKLIAPTPPPRPTLPPLPAAKIPSPVTLPVASSTNSAINNPFDNL